MFFTTYLFVHSNFLSFFSFFFNPVELLVYRVSCKGDTVHVRIFPTKTNLPSEKNFYRLGFGFSPFFVFFLFLLLILFSVRLSDFTYMHVHVIDCMRAFVCV